MVFGELIMLLLILVSLINLGQCRLDLANLDLLVFTLIIYTCTLGDSFVILEFVNLWGQFKHLCLSLNLLNFILKMGLFVITHLVRLTYA